MADGPPQRLQAVRGTRDIIGEDAARMAVVVDAFRRLAGLYGFQPVDVPIFEATELFARGIGETSDVVSKEMYSFADRSDGSLTLRPEFTAGLARAYLSNGWQQLAPLRLAAHGPAFRYERPQKGRYRQFHQIDAEIIGVDDAQADVELIALAASLLGTLGLAGKVELNINTLGDAASRAGYRDALVGYFAQHLDGLSEDSRMRLERNPLRILDSKDAGDRALIADAPLIDEFLTPEARHFFADLQRGLDAAGIAYVRAPRLVRGLDYYSHTAFEFITTHLGAQGTVIGGGRYDGLIEQLGGPPTPAVGWAGGIERLAMLVATPEPPRPDVAVIPLGEAAKWPALRLAQSLRAAGLAVEQGYSGNLKKRLARANAAGARLAFILGEDELATGQATLKNLARGSQSAVALESAVSAAVSALAQAGQED